jgi:hypothetical protein
MIITFFLAGSRCISELFGLFRMRNASTLSAETTDGINVYAESQRKITVEPYL